MRVLFFLAVVVLVVVGVVAYERDWFRFSASAHDGNVQINAGVNKEQWRIDRDEYRKQAEAQLAEMSKKLDDLKARAEHADGKTRQALNEAADAMNRKYQAARENLKEFADSTQENWQSVRTRTERALNDLKHGFENAASRFR